MQYRKDRYGNEISVLGFGCMRFTTRGTGIDVDKAAQEILAAVRAGVNYFDTAYAYAGNEAALGEIFERTGIRDEINIATKLPQYLVKKPGDFDRFFYEELRRLRTDHVDYYLMHMMIDAASWERLRALGAEDWLARQKAAGRIRQAGFSYHGGADDFCALLDAYDWDFCQIQYNYLDEHSQAGRTGCEYAASKGIPVIIMEPLRGGKLANKLPKDALRLFEKYNEAHSLARTPAEWGLRWLWNQPGVTCVLSGMNSLEMVGQNCAAADRAAPGVLTAEEDRLYADVVRAINAKMRVGCTGCRYCMPCPHNVDIPGTFSAYNLRYSDSWFAAEREYMMCTVFRKNKTAASNCIGCGLCEQHCPQHIAIRDELAKARTVLEGPVYKAAGKLIPIVYKY
ncbi:MAG: aldo/keto reductase [Mogibacterium sp.]|nr:aldo/keto reductase [Mogibacterium sp.]